MLNEKKISSRASHLAWIRKVKLVECTTVPAMPQVYPFWAVWIGRGATLDVKFFTAEDFE